MYIYICPTLCNNLSLSTLNIYIYIYSCMIFLYHIHTRMYMYMLFGSVKRNWTLLHVLYLSICLSLYSFKLITVARFVHSSMFCSWSWYLFSHLWEIWLWFYVVRVACEVLKLLKLDEASKFYWAMAKNVKDFGETNGLCISINFIDILLTCSVKHIMIIFGGGAQQCFEQHVSNKINMPSSWWTLLGSNPFDKRLVAVGFIGELYNWTLFAESVETAMRHSIIWWFWWLSTVAETHAHDLWTFRLCFETFWRTVSRGGPCFLKTPRNDMLQREGSLIVKISWRGDTGLTRLLGDPHSGFWWKYMEIYHTWMVWGREQRLKIGLGELIDAHHRTEEHWGQGIVLK